MIPQGWLSCEIQTVISALQADGLAGLAATAGIQFLVSVSGAVPASLVGMAAGAAYGPVTGFFVASCGLMAGGLAAFGLSRSALRPFLTRRLRRHRAWSAFERALGQDGWRTVCLVRLSPIMPFAVASYGFGLLPVTTIEYIIGSLASLPALALYVIGGHLAHVGLSAGGARHTLVSLLSGIGVVATLVLCARVGRFAKEALDKQHGQLQDK